MNGLQQNLVQHISNTPTYRIYLVFFECVFHLKYVKKILQTFKVCHSLTLGQQIGQIFVFGLKEPLQQLDQKLKDDP
jgi:hypothetical protein